MSDLVAFLRARLDEDEAGAKAAARIAGPEWSRDAQYLRAKSGTYLADAGSVDDEELAPFWAAHDPARVLREVEAGRRILASLAEHEECLDRGYAELTRGGQLSLLTACGALAAIWSDHPDYRQEWAPQQ